MSADYHEQESDLSQQLKLPSSENSFAAITLPRHSWSWTASVERHQHEVQALVIDHDSKEVLLQREGLRWVLPGFWVKHGDYEHVEEPSTMLLALEKVIGTVGTLAHLRLLWITEKEVRQTDGLCTLEKCVMLIDATKGHGLIGHEYKWVVLQEAEVYHLFRDARNAIREEIQRVLKGSTLTNLQAWQRPGWFQCAVSWMEDVLRQHLNVRLSQPVFVLRSSGDGVIFRGETTKGRFFLKCTSPLANDAAYTDALSYIVPRFVARPVAVDRGKQLMVTADYGEVLHTWNFSADETKKLSRDYVRLQKGTIGRMDELLNAGFPDLRPMRLLEEIDILPSDPMFQAIGSSEEYAPCVKFYCENTEQFKGELKKLMASDIPATVTHNDLFFTNMYKPADADHYMFFDWVKGFVGHPFTSLLDGMNTEAFLEEWKEYGRLGTEGLQELVSLGRCFHKFAFLVLQLREAKASEPPYTKSCLDEASLALQGFKYLFCELRRDVA